MSQTPAVQQPLGQPGVARLGVIDALRMGWQLLMGDFWPLWLVGLVAYLIQAAASIFGAIPYIGGCIQLAISVFVQPPLQAGFFYAVRRRIDGAPAQVNDLFEGFRQRYWPSVVAMLIPLLIGFGIGILIAGIVIGGIALAGGFGSHVDDELMVVAIIVAVVLCIPLLVAMFVVGLLFMFAMLTVWDHPESGWAAVKDSVRVVWANFWSVVGLALITFALGLAAVLASILTCCIGALFIMPFMAVWFAATMIYLYRSWTDQPLVQPVTVTPAGRGPVPPTSIEPPRAI